MEPAAAHNVIPNAAFKVEAAMSINEQILAQFHNKHHAWKNHQINFRDYYRYLESNVHTFHGEFYHGHLKLTAELYKNHEYEPWLRKIIGMLPV